MIKKFKGFVELFWDASRIIEIEVEANTELKAKKKIEQKVKKIYSISNNMIKIISIESI